MISWSKPFVREAVRSDRREFDSLVGRCHKHAYNVAYRLTGNHNDAEDVVQEAFIRAYRFFDRYDRNMPFENWLYRIISNVFIDEMRRKPKFRTQSLDQPVSVGSSGGEVMFELPDQTSDPEAMMMDREIDDRLQKALDTLPKDFRQAVIFADVQGMSYEEIAEIMGCSLGTVRSRLHRGRKLMRARLGIQQAEAF